MSNQLPSLPLMTPKSPTYGQEGGGFWNRKKTDNQSPEGSPSPSSASPSQYSTQLTNRDNTVNQYNINLKEGQEKKDAPNKEIKKWKAANRDTRSWRQQASESRVGQGTSKAWSGTKHYTGRAVTGTGSALATGARGFGSGVSAVGRATGVSSVASSVSRKAATGARAVTRSARDKKQWVKDHSPTARMPETHFRARWRGASAQGYGGNDVIQKFKFELAKIVLKNFCDHFTSASTPAHKLELVFESLGLQKYVKEALPEYSLEENVMCEDQANTMINHEFFVFPCNCMKEIGDVLTADMETRLIEKYLYVTGKTFEGDYPPGKTIREKLGQMFPNDSVSEGHYGDAKRKYKEYLKTNINSHKSQIKSFMEKVYVYIGLNSGYPHGERPANVQEGFKGLVRLESDPKNTDEYKQDIITAAKMALGNHKIPSFYPAPAPVEPAAAPGPAQAPPTSSPKAGKVMGLNTDTRLPVDANAPLSPDTPRTPTPRHSMDDVLAKARGGPVETLPQRRGSGTNSPRSLRGGSRLPSLPLMTPQENNY